MKHLLAVLTLILVAAAASAQPNLSYSFLRDNAGRPSFGIGLRPVVTPEMGVPPGTPFFDRSTNSLYYWSGSAWTAAAMAGSTTTAQIIFPDGTAAAPAVAGGSGNFGYRFDPANFMSIYSIGGTDYFALGAVGIGFKSDKWMFWYPSTVAGAAPDLILKRAAAGTLLQENGDLPQASRISGGFSGYVETGSVTEAITLDTGATTTDSTANLLPANSIIDFVTYRVTTTITTAVNFSIGDATTPARFVSGATGMVAGSTGVGILQNHPDVAAAAGPVQISAAKVRITTNANPGAGVIRVQVFYRTAGVPST